MTTEEQTKTGIQNESLREKLLYGTILGFVGLSATGLGFAGTLSDTKKGDTQYQHKHQYNIALNAEATRLACRALAIGSVYAICGVSLIVYGVWRITGAQNFQEFRAVFANLFPRRPVKPAFTPEMMTWEYLNSQLNLVKNSKQLYLDAKAEKEKKAAEKAATAATAVEGSSH